MPRVTGEVKITDRMLKKDMSNLIVFGDSHAQTYPDDPSIRTDNFPGCSALGLGNPASRRQAGSTIRNIIKDTPSTSILAFNFGKVDIDFILNKKYNTNLETTIEDCIDQIPRMVSQYVSFLRSIRTHDVHVLGLYEPHLTDDLMLANLRSNQEVFEPIDNTRVIPRARGATGIFSKCLATHCSWANIPYHPAPLIDMNKYMPSNPIDHHLDASVHVEWLPKIKTLQSRKALTFIVSY